MRIQKDVIFLYSALVNFDFTDVDLETIASFNKMKSLTNDMNSIIEALERSSLLQLSPDKRKVKRSTPINEFDSHGDANRSVYIVSEIELIQI